MEPKFRIAKESDVRGIVELCNAVFEENTSVEWAEEMFRKMQGDPNQIYVVGELEGEIIAHTKVTIVPTISEDLGTYAVLNHVCVKQDLRRGGIGTQLLDACMVVARHYGCKSVKLWSKNFRTAVHGLYEKYGFGKKDATFYEKIVE